MLKYLLLLTLAFPVLGMERAAGTCAQGGKVIVAPASVGGSPQTRGFVQSYKFCTVTVYLSGTVTKPSNIYSTNTGTVLANPFTADQFGQWFFYAANGRYDVQIAGGGPPALAAPYTFGDIQLFDNPTLTDFGGACDGSTDNTAALTAAIAAAPTLLVIPTGTCVFASSIAVPATMALAIQGVIAPASTRIFTINGGVLAASTQRIFSGAGTIAFGPGAVTQVYPEWWGAAADGSTACSTAIAAAYAALPAAGGRISFAAGTYSLDAALSFATSGKPVTLQGNAGSATNFTFVPVTGTALLFNYGTGLKMGHGLRDITLTGPGSSTSTIGVLFGGSQGAQGFVCENCKIQGFGTGAQLGANTWITSFNGGMLRNNGTNLLLPFGLTQAGENLQFNHVTFADAPSPFTNSVWVQGGGQEVIFTDCSFDSAQVRVGDAGTAAAQVVIKGSHFENPNGGTNYPFIVVDNNAGNYLRLTDSYMLNDTAVAGPTSFMTLQGGKVFISGLGMFTPAGSPLTNLAVMSNAVNVELYGFNDLSGNISGDVLGGTTSGFVVNFAGANTGSSTPQNFVLKAGDSVGGARLDVTGNIRSSAQLVSLQATGTAPLSVNSTTPVANLFANPLTFSAAGTQSTTTTHLVYGSATLSGGTVTITLLGSAIYTNSSSYQCNANDLSALQSVRVNLVSGSSFILLGTDTNNVNYVCLGN